MKVDVFQWSNGAGLGRHSPTDRSPGQRHVRLHAGLIQEDEAFRADPALMAHPALPPTLHVGPLVGDARHFLEAETADLIAPIVTEDWQPGEVRTKRGSPRRTRSGHMGQS